MLEGEKARSIAHTRRSRFLTYGGEGQESPEEPAHPVPFLEVGPGLPHRGSISSTWR